jgi:nicotinamide mononucleotide transporter
VSEPPAEGLLSLVATSLKATGAVEFAAVALGLAYVVLAARGNRWCWPAGGLSAVLLAGLSWQARLPMQALLQAYYVAMAVHGWRRWSVPATARPGWWRPSLHLVAVAAALLVAWPLTRVLQSQFASAHPWLDGATTLLSLVGTWLTARMRIESWLYWIAIDAVLVWLYAAQGLSATALLFVVYLVVSLIGFVSWIRLWRQQKSKG